MELQGKKAELANLLFDLEAVKFGAFRLKLHEKQPDAPLSPISLNLRTASHPKNPGPLTEAAMELVGDLFQEVIDQEHIIFDCYADIPDAGAPFGDQVERICANLDPRPRRLRLTKEVDEDGKRRILEQVEGDFAEGEEVLLVDELITQADSKFEAITALESAGLQVNWVLVLVDRLQGGSTQLAVAGYTLVAVFDLHELLDHYVATGRLDLGKADEVREYLAANQVA